MQPQDASGARRPDVVAELLEMSITIDYGVIRLGPATWGVRGHIAYDGDVLAAVFPTESEAWVAISPLRRRVVAGARA